jgi:hypothetical protein
MRASFPAWGILLLVTVPASPSWAAPSTAQANPVLQESSIDIRTRTLISGGLLVPSIASGYWLTNAGEPRNTALFTTHKLAAVSNLVLLDITLYQRNEAVPLDATELTAAFAMNLCFVGTIATGALLSVNKPMPEAVHVAHRAAPWLTVLATSAVLYLLNRAD